MILLNHSYTLHANYITGSASAIGLEHMLFYVNGWVILLDFDFEESLIKLLPL